MRAVVVDCSRHHILVYAHREDTSWHDEAMRCITKLAEGNNSWAIPWPCLHEFLAIVTHPRIFKPPTPITTAVNQVEAWLESPSLILLAEAANYWSEIRAAVLVGRIAGPAVHDARIAALCKQHGVQELWSADRDFSRFTDLILTNPLV